MELTDQWTEKFGTTFKYKGFFGADRLYISDTAAINHVVNAHFYRYPKADVTRQRISRVLGDGLVWAEVRYRLHELLLRTLILSTGR